MIPQLSPLFWMISSFMLMLILVVGFLLVEWGDSGFVYMESEYENEWIVKW